MARTETGPRLTPSRIIMVVRKSIVITGASSGFGAAFAWALADDGHDLFICARRADRLAQVAAGRSTIFHEACDVSEEAQVENFFRQVAARTNSLDVVIHCAGILGPLGGFETTAGKEWLTAVTANLGGVYFVAKHALPLLRAEERPRILVLSGGGAFDPMPCVSAYGVSKAATVRLVETLAVELKFRNIAVNAIAPGFAATEIHAATLAAGRERAGEHFDKTVKLMSNWDNSMDVPVDCIRYMISDKAAKLTGKTISARYDPWGEPEFDEHIDEIMASPLYTTLRTTAEHLANSPLARTLALAAERKHSRRGRKSPEGTKHFPNQTALTE
jgi:NAD(P)-dependent dehydrogenase (short-subunit alcohol dehydrogenase family)